MPTQHTHLSLLGVMSEDYDPGSGLDRLAIGLLGAEAKARAICTDCLLHFQANPGATADQPVVYVENYHGERGQTFTLCARHIRLRLYHALPPRSTRHEGTAER